VISGAHEPMARTGIAVQAGRLRSQPGDRGGSPLRVFADCKPISQTVH